MSRLLIAKLLRKVLETNEARQFHTLSWGRLYPYGNPNENADTTMAVRLALAAKRSREWDSERGRPRHREANGWVDVNGTVRTLANDAAIYKELQPVFVESGLELQLSSVEKVLIFRAGQMPFFKTLQESGVRASGPTSIRLPDVVFVATDSTVSPPSDCRVPAFHFGFADKPT